jgi:hypothetical protein
MDPPLSSLIAVQSCELPSDVAPEAFLPSLVRPRSCSLYSIVRPDILLPSIILPESVVDEDPSPGSITDLLAPVTINGVTKTPTFRYRGGDVYEDPGPVYRWPAWGYAADEYATVQTGSGWSDGEMDPCGEPRAFLFGTDPPYIYAQTPTTGWDLGVDDVYFECMFQTDDLAQLEQAIASKNYSWHGWWLWITAAKRLAWGMSDNQFGTGNVSIESAVLEPNTWYFAAGVLDRSGSGQLALQGVASGSPVVISSVGDITANGYEFLGCENYTTSHRFRGKLAYISVWQGPGWVDTHAQDDLFEERYNLIQECFADPPTDPALESIISVRSDALPSVVSPSILLNSQVQPRSCALDSRVAPSVLLQSRVIPVQTWVTETGEVVDS